MALTIVAGWLVVSAGQAEANHPVLVEGNCLNPPAGNPGPVTPGTCGDYDGDGNIGTAEDNDGDRVFGTINAALNDATTGANQNGSVTIVTSGVFAEQVTITAANGNVTLEAAPGVEANVDAVLQGDPGTTDRQNQPGIVVDAPFDRHVSIRNIMSRNWTSGFLIRGGSRVTLDGVTAENNTDYGVEVRGRARVAISNSSVQATGRRVSPAGDFPRANDPDPGKGIEYEGRSSGTVCFSTVTGSFDAGISERGRADVIVSHVNVFDNRPDLEGVTPSDDCVRQRDRGRRTNAVIETETQNDSGLPFLLLGVGLVMGLASLVVRGRVARRQSSGEAGA